MTSPRKALTGWDIMQTNQKTGDRSVTTKEALRNWKGVTDMALREPVIITSHNKPRHVIVAYDRFVELRDRERQVYRTADLPDDLREALIASLTTLRAPPEDTDHEDVIID